jgi:plasmid stabilization system protein ParE
MTKVKVTVKADDQLEHEYVLIVKTAANAHRLVAEIQAAILNMPDIVTTLRSIAVAER